MSQTQAIPLENIEQTGARVCFLVLRDAAGLPSGGEICLKAEVEQVAEALGMDVPQHWSRKRIVFEMLRECRRRRGRHQEHRDWEYVQQDHVARDYGYIQSREARMLAEEIANQSDQTFEWNQ